MIDGTDDAFDRRQHVEDQVAALDRHYLLSLTNPPVQPGDLNAVDLAQHLAGKCVDADTGILSAFIEHPRVAGMEAIAFRNFKTQLRIHLRSRRAGP